MSKLPPFRNRSGPTERGCPSILATSVAALLRRLSAWSVLSLALLGAMKVVHAQSLHYWDSDGLGANNSLASGGAGLGGTGNWDTSSSLWWMGTPGAADQAWVNASNDTAVFWGTAGMVTLTAPIQVGGLQFNTTGYTIGVAGNTVTFGANTNVTLDNVAAATITANLAGTANINVNGGAFTGLTAGTLTLNGTGASFTGTTTIGNAETVTLSGSTATALSATTGITLNGGGLNIVNTTSDSAITKVAASAITSNGGTISYNNTAGAINYAMSLGALTAASGQTNVVSTNATNAGSTEVLTLANLVQSGTGTISIVGGGGLNTTTNQVVVAGATATAAGGIIGPWLTTGTAANALTDYAVYNASKQIVAANIAASAETTWGATYAATNNYTLTTNLGSTTATRNINSLKYNGTGGTIMTIATGFNFDTYGILQVGSTATGTIAGAGTGVLSTPSGGGNLYLTTGTASGLTISAPIVDNGGAVTPVISGTSVVSLSGINLYTGGTVVNGGTLSIGANTNLGAAAGGLTFNGNSNLTLSAGTSLGTVGTPANRSITLNNGAMATVTNGAFGNSIIGDISGTGGFIIAGTNGQTVTFGQTGSTSTYTGPTSIMGGTLAAGAANAFGTNSAMVLANTSGVVLNITGFNTSIGSLSGGGTTGGNVTLGTATLTVGGNNESTTYAGIIGPTAGTFTKVGTGDLTFTGADTYTGSTSVTGGILQLGTTASAGSIASASAVSITTGATLALVNLTGNTFANNVTNGVGGVGTLTINSANSNTLSGTLSDGANGQLALTQSGGGTTILNTTESYTGATNVTGGMLAVNGSIASGSTVNVATAGTLSGSGTINGNATMTGSGAINFTTGGSIGGTLAITGGNWNGVGSVSGVVTSSSGNFNLGGGSHLTAPLGLSVTGGTISTTDTTATLTGSLNYASASSSTFNAAIAGTGSTLTVNMGASAVLYLGGTDTYGGATQITSGMMVADSSRTLSGTGITVSSGATLGIAGGVTPVNSIPVQIAGSGITSGVSVGALFGSWNGNPNFTSSYSGAITLAANATISVFGSGGAVTGVFNLTGGIITAGHTVTLGWEGSHDGTINVNSVIGGAGAVLVDFQTAALNASNSYTGSTTLVSGSNLDATVVGALPAPVTDGGTGTVRSAVLLDQTGSGGSTLALGANQAIFSLAGATTSKVTLGTSTLTIGNSTGGTTTFAGIISGGNSAGTSIAKDGTSTEVFSGSNTYVGATSIVGGGTLQANGVGALPAPTADGGTGTVRSAVLMDQTGSGGSTLALGAKQAILSLTGAATSAVTLGTSTLTIGNTAGGTTTFAGIISGGNAAGTSIVKDGTSTEIFSASNTYVGATSIFGGGELNATVVGALPAPAADGGTGTVRSAVLMDQTGSGGSTLALGANQAILSLTGAANSMVTLGTSTLTIGNSAGGITTFAGVISGGNSAGTSIIIGGTGTEIFSGANTYTGATSVASGELAVGSPGSLGNIAISVTNAGSTFAVLAGSGSVNLGSTTTASAGATLSLGSGTIFSMNDGAIGTANLLQGAGFASTGLTISGATLDFDIGTTGADHLFVTNSASVTASTINLTAAAGATSIPLGIVPLITTGGGFTGTGTNNFTLGTPTVTVTGTWGTKVYTLTLSGAQNTATQTALTVTVAAPTAAYWSGAVDGNWNTGSVSGVTNWRTDATSNVDAQAVPNSTTNVFFNTTTPGALQLMTNNLAAPFSIASLTFTSGATSAVTITDSGNNTNTLTLGAAGLTLNNNTGTDTLNANVILGANQTWTNNSTGSNVLVVNGSATSPSITGSGLNLQVAGAGNMTIAAPLNTGSGSLTMNGSGLLTLSGANGYTGPTNVTTGTLAVNGSIASGSTVNVATAGTLSGSGTINGNATMTGSGAINFTTGGNIVGTLAITGGNWNGVGSVGGVVTSSSGNFNLGSGSSLTAPSGLSVTGGTISTTDTTATLTGSLNYASAGASTFNAAIVGAGSTLTVNMGTTTDDTTLSLGGADTYGGATQIISGMLVATGNGVISGTGVTVTSGATLAINAGITTASIPLQIGGAGVTDSGIPLGALFGSWNADPSFTSSYSGAITLTANATIGVFGNDGTVTGLFNLTGGINTAGHTVTLGWEATNSGVINVNGIISGSGAVLVDSQVATLGASNIYTGSTSIINGGILNANTTGALPAPAANGGTGTVRSAVLLDQTGSGGSTLALGANQAILSLTGAATSKVTLGTSTLTIGNSAGGTATFAGIISGGNAAGINIIIDGAGTEVFTALDSYVGATQINSGATLQVGNGGTSGHPGSGSIMNNGILTVDRSNSYGITQAIGGVGVFNQSGTTGSVTTLSVANTYTGATNVTGGTLQLGSTGALGSGGSNTSGVTVSAGAALDLKGNSPASVPLNLNGQFSSTVGALTNSSGSATYGGVVALQSPSSIGGTGNITLGNTVTGAFNLTIVGTGTVIATSSSNTFTTATVSAVSTFQIGNGSTTGHPGTGTITDNGAVTVDRNNSYGITNAIGGSGVLNQSGASASVTTLSAAETYTGATNVNAGTLVVAVSISGTANVNVGNGTTPATLGGTGTITTGNLGTITVANAATLAPDQTPGSSTAGLTIDAATSGTSTLAFSTSSTLQLSIANSNSGSAGAPLSTNYSKLTIGTGVAVDLNGTIATTVSGTINNGDLFTIIINSGSTIPTMFNNAGLTLVSGSTYSFTSGGHQWEINYGYDASLGLTAAGINSGTFAGIIGGHDVALVAIPEPDSLSMLAGSLGLAFGLRRFRRRHGITVGTRT